MAKIGWDFRDHGLSAGAGINDGNIAAFAMHGCSLDTSTGGNGAITAQGTSEARFADPDASSYAFIESLTTLSGDAASFQVLIPANPTPGSGDYREILIRNAANSGDVIRLVEDSSRRWHMYDGGGTLVCGPLTAVADGVMVRLAGSFDLSAGTADLWQFTTNPLTSTTPDDSDSATGQTFNGATDIGRVRGGAPHSTGVVTIGNYYAEFDDTTTAALPPLPAQPTATGTPVEVVGFDLSAVPAGGSGAPFTIDTATQQTGTPVTGLDHNDTDLILWMNRDSLVDTCTFDVVFKDSAGTPTPTRTVTLEPAAGSGGGGEFVWDLAKVGGPGFVGFTG